MNEADISRNAAISEIWRLGAIEELLLHEGQQFIQEKMRGVKGNVIVLNISRQWGKTFGAVVMAIVACQKPFTRVRIGAALETDLVEFIEPAFESVLATCPLSLRPTYVQQKKRYKFKNGSSIKLVGLDKKPNGLRGNTIDLIIIDEAGFAKRLNYLYESVIIPLTTHRPNARIIFQSTPPETPDHEFWDFVDRAKLSDTYLEFTIDQNPLLSADDVKRIEDQYVGGRENSAFKREYLCKRIIEKERAIIPEWEDKYAVEVVHDDLYQYWHKYEALDIGVQIDKTVELFAYYNFLKAQIVIEHEMDISGVKTTTDLIHQEHVLKEKGIGYQFPYRRIADSSHPLLLNDLSAKGVSFVATDKAKIHEMVGEVRVWVQSGRILVHPRCKQLLGCLSAGIWNNQRTEFGRSKVFGHYDALAALVYLVRNVDQYTNPIPAHVNNPNHWPGFDRPVELSPLGQDMKAIFSRRLKP